MSAGAPDELIDVDLQKDVFACWQVPLLNSWVNHMRSGLYAALAWIGFMLVVLTFETDNSYNHRNQLTIIAFAGMAPIGMLAGLASFLMVKFKSAKGHKNYR